MSGHDLGERVLGMQDTAGAQELCIQSWLSIEATRRTAVTGAQKGSAFCWASRNKAARGSLSFDLTERELMVLRHAAKGVKRPEIAVLVVLTDEQLKEAIESALHKVGARNMMQMLARCATMGVI